MNHRNGPIAWRKILAGLLLLITVLGALNAWYTLSWLGFPDGHLTEFDRAWEPLLKFLLYGNLAFAAYFGSQIFSETAEEGTTLFWLCAGIYVLSLTAYFYKVHDYGLRLDSGQGG